MATFEMQSLGGIEIVAVVEEKNVSDPVAYHRISVALATAAETGLRPGEVCGLDWRNVDLEACVVHVCQSAWRGHLVSPKTQAGFREVAISSQLVNHLRPSMKNEGLLFQYENGRPWREEKVREKKLNPLLDKLGLERKGLHAFRHFNATQMDRHNIPMKTRQERLGHSDPRITMGMRNRNGYTHMASADDRLAAELFGSILCPSCVLNPGSEAGV